MNWEGSEIDLFIEYVSVLGKSLVLYDQAPTGNEVYKIQHTNSEMTAIPSNLCDWDTESNLMTFYQEEFKNMENFLDNIVTINFEGNKIKNVPDLNCLSRLDSLILRNNEITSLGNSSISQLSYLRTIDFSGNFITNIDPNTLTSPYLSLFFANFSYNEMTKLDVSNAMSLHPFCKIDYKSNKVTEITNEANFKLDLEQTYGPGFVSIEDNQISTFPDFKEILSLDYLAQLGTLLSFGFDFQGIPIICDCHLEPFMTLAKDIIATVWQDYLNITCTGPKELEGRSVHKIDPALFTCPILAESGCQTPECTCVDKPNEDTLVVDCSNAGLKEMPKLPNSKFSKYISLNVSGNHITKLNNNSMLSKLSILDISRNDLRKVEDYEARMLENATQVYISFNPRLLNLPQTIQYHNVCLRSTEGLQINCNCESLWIEEWVHSRSCTNSNRLFTCVLSDNSVKPALHFAEHLLECYETGIVYILITIIIGALLFLIIIAGIAVYFFRYEILIIFLRARQTKRNIILPSFQYDVFLSYNDKDDDVSQWVENILDKNLIRKGYKVFRSNRDIPFGEERDSHVISTMAKTKNFLIIMTDSYLEEEEDMRPWTENEWKYGWNHYKMDRTNNIVLVNFDHVSSFKVIHPQIKAFLRVGSTVDFKNRDGKIMEEIYTKLGRPWPKPNAKVPAQAIYMKSPFEQYTAIMCDNNDNLVTAEENKSTVQDNDIQFAPLEKCKANMNTDSKESDFETESRKSQRRGNTHRVQNNKRKCIHRQCYACHVKDEHVNLPSDVNFNKRMEIFTLTISSSRPNSSSSRVQRERKKSNSTVTTAQ